MRDAARAAGVVNAVTFNYRYHPVAQQARAMIANGNIGTPALYTADTCRNGCSTKPISPGDWNPTKQEQLVLATPVPTGTIWPSSLPGFASYAYWPTSTPQ
ncbi:MAG TPA: hypothetical protein VFA90_17775 [Terriglobales bacterium]|nr:hypothetical protein [Terriglobales bacterium]